MTKLLSYLTPISIALLLATPCAQAQNSQARSLSANSMSCTAPSGESGGLQFPADQSYLRTAISGNAAYDSIDGMRMKQLVEEQTAIARRYRDAGNQFWGRIIGTASDHETADWMAEQLRNAGAENVRLNPIDLPPQWLPDSWELTASHNGQDISLVSAWPTYGSVGTAPGGLELELIDVGLGMETDFQGRDVNGKAVIVHSIPTSGAIINSARQNGAIRRADEKGAAAILVVLELPGNLQMSLYESNTAVPTLAIGSQDGAALQEMLTSGDSVTLNVKLEVEELTELSTSTVRGVVPAASPDAEKIVIVAHRDSLFEGGSDNASGVATAIELVRYFARVPLDQRLRSIEIVGTPGHHNLTSTGFRWLSENQGSLLQNAALLINAEHTAHALVDRWGGELCATNAVGPFSWRINGSAELQRLTLQAFDDFGIPRWAETGGPTGEIRPIANAVPSIVLMHAGVLLHSNIETAGAVPAISLAATTRAYARIIDEVNRLEASRLAPLEK
ncbi:MAG: hypothetical protein COB20_11710 [SAR86 cluster bacterium]|uniref:Carboxypeptidase Q n=1 Tax=SAR86 cluster bacterium TaxID=2030880 RepID=A0A2A4X0U9_9GAMM|nr:MAG: hypothetical protein COB20_11710 [SAR86 cluster bacterium]